MGTNQKYSARIHTRRQLVSINNHLASARDQLNTIYYRYQKALPSVSLGCEKMIDLITMIEALVEDIRENI